MNDGPEFFVASQIQLIHKFVDILKVGGNYGAAFKIGRSGASLPLRIEVEKLVVNEDLITRINDRLVLVYTGTVRLARNLLQVRQLNFNK